MSKVAAFLKFCLVVVLAASGQEHEAGPIRAVRFDQFGQVGHCDMGARLDNFAIALEAMLEHELESYSDYMKTVKWRIIPFVFLGGSSCISNSACLRSC
jgi:hypothetical protein